MKYFVFKITLIASLWSICKAQSWSQQGTGSYTLDANGMLYTMLNDNNGNIYVPVIHPTKKCYVARWNGGNWSKLGNLDTSLISQILAMCKDPSGKIYVSGVLGNGQSAYVFRWNGTTWTNLGLPPNAGNYNLTRAMCSDASGNIYVAGSFEDANSRCQIAKWNGISWSALPGIPSPFNGCTALTLHCDATGNLYAAGRLLKSGMKGFVAKWDGAVWTELGTGINALDANDDIYTLAGDAAGNIYAAGKFYNTNGTYVAKWNGSSWSELGTGTNLLNGNGPINSIVLDGQGNLYAGGKLLDSLYYYQVKKWNGTTWSQVGNLNAENEISKLCIDPSGNLYAAGYFRNADDRPYVAKYATGIVGIPYTYLDSKNGINIWPNPSSGNFKVSLDEKLPSDAFLIEIIATTGQIVYKENSISLVETGNYEVHLQNITPGIYTLRISSSNGSQTRKLLIEK